jgi:hypothetical protein
VREIMRLLGPESVGNIACAMIAYFPQWDRLIA